MAVPNHPEILKILNKKWAVLVLYCIARYECVAFNTLMREIIGISPNTLSSRLKMFEAFGSLERRQYSTHPPRFCYALTTEGRQIASLINELAAVPSACAHRRN
jgi:DNA-binding HxlR family transcriptional regulator